MLNYLSALITFLYAAAPVALAFAAAIGVTGSAIELFGLFLCKFASPKAQAVGNVLVKIGKSLEAIGADLPKLVTNALGWVGKVAKLVGVKAGTNVLLALVLGGVCTGLFVACTSPPAPCSLRDAVMLAHGAECAARVKECGDNGECKALVRDDCNRWGDARCGFVDAGEAGSHD